MQRPQFKSLSNHYLITINYCISLIMEDIVSVAATPLEFDSYIPPVANKFLNQTDSLHNTCPAHLAILRCHTCVSAEQKLKYLPSAKQNLRIIMWRNLQSHRQYIIV
jgi:hypothetical protein